MDTFDENQNQNEIYSLSIWHCLYNFVEYWVIISNVNK